MRFLEVTYNNIKEQLSYKSALSEYKYQVIGTDMFAAALPALERAELYMNFLEALLELFLECDAVYFHNSGKLLK